VPVSSYHSESSSRSSRRGPERPRPQPPAFALYRWLDGASALLIVAVILWGPWSFGCTPRWAIEVHNYLGYALGGLLLLKVLLRRANPALLRDRLVRPNWLDTGLVLLSVLLLLYTFTSAWNARLTSHPGSWKLSYRDAVTWLPHSFDQVSSWRAFALYLGLAGFFWAVRDWIRYPPPARNRDKFLHDDDSLLPRRVRILLWILCLNGTLLAIQGIAQRVSGSNQLLWLLTPRINKTPDSQFGPYAYRANAAQYFNLVWPVALGLWWTYRRPTQRRSSREHPAARPDDPSPPATGPRSQRGHLLLSCVLLMAVCPIVSTSRGGAIIMVGLAVMALAILGSALWRSSWASKLALLSLLTGMVGMGVLLGWEELGPRMEMLEQGYEQREAMFETGRRMAADSPVFGTGPGTFDYLYQFYRRSDAEYWPAQMHNDWLELQITFGAVGLGLLLTALALALGRWFARGGLPGEKHFVLLTWCALGGCLLHARFDFPFQITSLVALFLFLCAVLSCLSRPNRQLAA
jgi:O-antigen ligase